MDEKQEKTARGIISDVYERCREAAPNYGITAEQFADPVIRSIEKYLVGSSETPASNAEIIDFVSQLQAEDLFLAIGCAAGNERAWWEFDQQHRSYMERVARHLARTDVDADEAIGSVYVELYGTRVVDGERVSKFRSYSGRGSLRGWLRTVIWHSIVDQHRASHDEVSLDEMTENVGEGAAHANFASMPAGGEDAMLEVVTQNRYRSVTRASIRAAFDSLEPHERLLLMYYHVDELKLREISKLVENPSSPLRGWFQRRSQSRDSDPNARIHESTIMRWLERCYGLILQRFKTELADVHGLTAQEIDICKGLAADDMAGSDLYSDVAVK